MKNIVITKVAFGHIGEWINTNQKGDDIFIISCKGHYSK